MEGYLNLRIQPWLRRLITRLVAIIPAYFAILYFGDDKTGELLVLSQVVLSMQLGFAIIPLIHFVSDKKNMGEFVIGPLAKIGAWITALIIVSLNVKLVYETIHGWIVDSSDPTWIWVCVVPAAIFFAILLIYITILPIVKSKLSGKSNVIHGNVSSLNITTPKPYSKIAITVDFSVTDSLAVSKAISQGGIDAEYVLVHIVETAGARMMNNEIYDYETLSDKMHLDTYVNELKAKGYQVSYKLGYGSPKTAIPPIVNDSNADLLVMGAHGHKGLKDIILGTTLDAVRHEVNIPVLIVKV